MTTIQIRVNDKLKKSAKKILDELGLDMSTAVKLYLCQIVAKKGIPFRIITENGLTLQQELDILKASQEAKRGINTTGPLSWEESQEFLDSLKNRQNEDDED